MFGFFQIRHTVGPCTDIDQRLPDSDQPLLLLIASADGGLEFDAVPNRYGRTHTSDSTVRVAFKQVCLSLKIKDVTPQETFRCQAISIVFLKSVGSRRHS
jgi:hypothetical protein